MHSLFSLNRKRSYGISLGFAAVFFAAAPLGAQFPGMKESIWGHTGSQFSKQQFQMAMHKVIGSVSKSMTADLSSGKLKGIEGVESLDTEGAKGSWKLTLTAYKKEGNFYTIRRSPCVVTNYGNGMQYAFVSQNFNDLIFDAVNNKQAKLHKKMIEKYDDVEVEVGRSDNLV